MERQVWERWRLELDSGARSRPRRSIRLLLPFTRQVPVYLAATVAVCAILVGLWVGQRGAQPGQGARSLPLSHPERFTPLEDSRAPITFASTPRDAMSLLFPTHRDTL